MKKLWSFVLLLPMSAHRAQAQESAQQGPIHVSSSVMAGNRQSGSSPYYPKHPPNVHGGTVVLHAVIDKEGAVASLEAVSGPEWMIPQALITVKEWHYTPYLVDGEPVSVETKIVLNISLN